MPVSRETIVVVEDELEVGQLVIKVAGNVGFEGTLVTNHKDLAKQLDRAEPTVITLDLRLPGHDGVEVLRQLGERRMRSFVVLISGIDQRTLASAQRIGESYGLRILGSIRKPFALDALRDLLQKARNQAHAFSESDLEAAISDGQFFLEFQPKVAINGAARKVAGAEALARWRHPARGVVPPIEFIPMLEKSPLIKPFTLGVLRSAAAQRRAWAEAGHDVTIAVNIAAGVIDDPGVPEKFVSVVEEERCPTDKIMLELTETGVMADAAKSMEVLTRLRLKGFGLSMDDFGTGYSSMVQLHRMPFSEIKVDRSFVGEMNVSDQAAAIVRTVINLGHDLGVKVCAEGVEDKATHERLAAAKCDLAQGYYYGKPMAAAISPGAWNQTAGR